MIKITITQNNLDKPYVYEVSAWVRSKKIGTIQLQIEPDYVIEKTSVKCGVIGEIVVDNDYRMQGVSQQMLKVAMEKFAKEKVDLAVIEDDSEKVLKLSERVGFVKFRKANILIASVSNKEIFDLLRQKDSDVLIQ